MGKIKASKSSMERTRSLTALALGVAVAMLLSYIESRLPSLAIPGVKLGLANVAVMITLYKVGVWQAITVSAVRVFLIALLFGNPVSLIYGILGAVFSLVLMALLKRFSPLSPIGVSVAGGVAHNLGQICGACLVMGTVKVAYYLPVLLLSGTLSGIAIGVCSGIIIKRVKI